MRVAQVIPHFSSGGIASVVMSLVRALAGTAGLELEVWAFVRMKDFVNEPAALAYEAECLELCRSLGVGVRFVGKRIGTDRIKCMLSLRQLYRQARPDIVHIHLAGYTRYAVLGLYGLRPRLVETLHSVQVSSVRLRRLLLSRKTDRFVAICRSVSGTLTGTLGLPGEKIRLIYNGIDLKAFGGGARRARGDVAALLSVGRLDAEKNQTLLLDMMAILHERLGPDKCPVLLLAGDGTERKALEEKAAKLLPPGAVKFLGLRRDVAALLADADLFVMSSVYEGFSISFLEAMANGLPIVATDVGGNFELVERGVTGLLTPSGDAGALAGAVLRLMGDGALRESMSRAALENVKEFSLESFGAKHLAVYRELIEAKPR